MDFTFWSNINPQNRTILGPPNYAQTNFPSTGIYSFKKMCASRFIQETCRLNLLWEIYKPNPMNLFVVFEFGRFESGSFEALVRTSIWLLQHHVSTAADLH